MSNVDVTVTDRDRAAARKLPIGCECNCKYNVRCHHDEIALALAQARSEGREESKRVLVGDEAGQYIADVLDGLVARFPNTVIPVGELSKIATNLRIKCPNTASTKTDANECKDDLIEFLKAAWDPDTGFTNGNSFYRLLGPLYEKYCGTKTAQEDASV